ARPAPRRLAPQLTPGDVDELLAVVGLLEARLARRHGHRASRPVLGADQEPHEHVARATPAAVRAAQDTPRGLPRTCAGEVPDDALDGVHALVEIRPRPRVR